MVKALWIPMPPSNLGVRSGGSILQPHLRPQLGTRGGRPTRDPGPSLVLTPRAGVPLSLSPHLRRWTPLLLLPKRVSQEVAFELSAPARRTTLRRPNRLPIRGTMPWLQG